MLTYAALLGLLTLVSGQVEIRPLNNTGILFEPLGTALLFQDKWIILTKVIFEDTTTTLNFVEQCEGMIIELCQLQPPSIKDRPCHQWQSEITQAVRRIRNLIDGITISNRKTRRRREILNGIGRLSKFLFGTMDDRDAKVIYEKLGRLEQHDLENIHMISEQVSIVKSTFNTLESTIGNITEQQVYLGERFNQLTEKMTEEFSKLQHELQAVHLQTDLNEIVLFMITKLQKLYFQLSEEHTILTALHQHKLHPLILSAKDLTQAYQNITNAVPGHQFLTDFHLLGQAIEVDYVQIETGFLVRITIPLTETESYTLNKVFLLPIATPHTQVTLLDIDTNYILNNTDNQHYVEFTQPEFNNNCKRYTDPNFNRIYICEQSRPKLTAQNPQQCLANLLANPTGQATMCSHRVLTSVEDFITQLERKNEWLFSFREPQTLTIHCPRKNRQVTMEKVGILALKNACTFLLGQLELPYQRDYANYLPVHQPDPEMFPKLNISNYDMGTPKPNPSKTTSIRLKTPDDYNKALRQHSETIADFERRVSLAELGRKSQAQSVHTYVNTAATVVVVVILFLLVLKKIQSSRRKAYTPPVSEYTGTNTPISIELNSINPANGITKRTRETENTPAGVSQTPVKPPTPPPLPRTALPGQKPLGISLKDTTSRKKSFRIKL